MDEVWLRLDQIVKSFRVGFWGQPKVVIDGISLELKKGRVTGFVGPNGAGKTTLIKLILGFIHPDQGSILYGRWGSDLKAFREHLGYLPERPYYYPFLTAEEYMWMSAGLIGLGKNYLFTRQRIESALKKVALWEDRKILLRHFSKGMLQRLGLAACFWYDPEVLILDEPMSGLDPDGRWDVKQILLQIKQSGQTLLFTSHLLEDVETMADDVIVMHRGRLVYHGPLEKLYQVFEEDNLYKILKKLQVQRQ